MTTAELVYFLHIPKTSGTSLRATFVAALGEDAVSPQMLWDQVIDGDFTITPRTKVVVGHFAGLFPLWLKATPKIITMLREPLGRALSHINHVQRYDFHPQYEMARGLGVEAFCAHPVLGRAIDNLQSRYLASLAISAALVPGATNPGGANPGCWRGLAFEAALTAMDSALGLRGAAIHSLEAVDAVGLCEDHARSVRLFARALGWDLAAAGPEKRLHRAGADQWALESLGAADVEALRDRNAVDLAVYEFAQKLFERTCDRLGVGDG